MGENIIELKNISVEVSGRRILNDINLQIREGEVHVLFGPNGSGKSSLIMAILGFPAYKIVSGKILFKGRDITNLPTDERVKMGIGVAFQNPPAIRGVKLAGILRHLIPNEEEINELLRKVKLPASFLERDINLGFSGGEIKKSEILQVLAQKSDLFILDEPDSGVDVENLRVLGTVINEALQNRSALIITHLGVILQYINANIAHVLMDGTIVCSGNPTKILGQILNEGYAWCEKCPKVKTLRCEP
ncbi:MAG: ABC transporter ATP-binding protein [Candidatus Bathyarchaeota archaeon]|nr:ABC transporter ATP-binding protein [Candidatus Bathyarchaeota archaeon]